MRRKSSNRPSHHPLEEISRNGELNRLQERADYEDEGQQKERIKELKGKNVELIVLE